MKKSILLTFVIAAAFAATFLSGCGKGAVDVCIDFPRNDTGGHAISAFGLTIPGINVHDSLQSSVSGNRVTIISKALNMTISGTQDASNCTNIKLDTFRVGHGPSDTLKIPTTTLPLPGGMVKIWDVLAVGSGTLTAAGVTTDLTVISAESNIIIPGPPAIDLQHINSTFNLHLLGNLKREK